jgi:hypothetical protein
VLTKNAPAQDATPAQGQSTPVAPVPETPVFQNGQLAVPGAPQDTQDTPAKYSAKNTADDKIPTMALPLPLTVAQKRDIRDRIAMADGAIAAIDLKPADEVPAWVDLQGLMLELPLDLRAAVPFVTGDRYVNLPDKILLVNPRERIVIGEIIK